MGEGSAASALPAVARPRHEPLLAERAPAKVNLTLAVRGRREDGFHELESLVAFAGAGDLLHLAPGPELDLVVRGPFADAAGPDDDNLVMRAARGFAAAFPGAATGRFALLKRLPAAAGLGGGSSDAAATLRLLARLNAIALDAPPLREIAAALGSDVPVCLDPRARVFRGRGERIGTGWKVRPLPAVLANPGVAVPTGAVFAALGLKPGQTGPSRDAPALPDEALGPAPFHAVLGTFANDLQAPALSVAPEIAVALSELAALPEAQHVRMSGSGATCFAVFASCRAAAAAARRLRRRQPGWWIRSTVLR